MLFFCFTLQTVQTVLYVLLQSLNWYHFIWNSFDGYIHFPITTSHSRTEENYKNLKKQKKKTTPSSSSSGAAAEGEWFQAMSSLTLLSSQWGTKKTKTKKSEISFTKSSWQFFCFLEFIHGFLVSVSVPKFYGFIETEKTKWKISKVVSVSMFLVFYI